VHAAPAASQTLGIDLPGGAVRANLPTGITDYLRVR
jgi:hypothetical protein